jgi:hypothetical protein
MMLRFLHTRSPGRRGWNAVAVTTHSGEAWGSRLSYPEINDPKISGLICGMKYLEMEKKV